MTDISKEFDKVKAQMAAFNKAKQNEEMQVEKAKRDLARERMESIAEFEFRVLALCKEYEARCKDSASMLRSKANRAIDIAAGRAKDFSGA